MPFPHSARVIYDKNPLAEVICQLRFPPILRITAAEPADFQDELRALYPMYSVQEAGIPQLPKEFAGLLEQLNLPRPLGSSVHRFYTRDSQRSVSLSQNFLALSESKYSRWEIFRSELEKAVNALKRIYQPSFYTRIGLRYRNVISRNDLGLSKTRWVELVQPYALGPLGDHEVAESVTETQTQSVIRLVEVPGGQVRLVNGLIVLPGRQELCYVIDADLSITNEEGIDEPLDVLDRFNRLAGNLFRWAITGTLHQAMEPRSI